MERDRSLPLMVSVIATLAIVGGMALWYRAGPREAVSAVQADAEQRVSSGAGTERRTPLATPVPESVDASSAMRRSGSTTATGSVPAGDADQRQLAKITRGMSAAAAGGILVTATPPGSVTSQLRLREGDVIVAVNGDTVSSPDDFARIYREQGLPRQLTIVRDGREIHRH